MAKFRILSLDGGGSWALIQVRALIDIFSDKGDGTDVTGYDVLKEFDLVVANSGGTITLGGLIKDLKLADILAFFLSAKQRNTVFVPASFWADPFAHVMRVAGIGPKYDAAAKLKGLKALLGPSGEQFVSAVPATIGANYSARNPDVVFCAFDYDSNREVFFRSNSQSLAASMSMHRDITVALAIHASSNAPLNYFDAPAQGPNGTRYWDGALGGYNNPLLAGVIEALANAAAYDTSRADIRALSIGTANVALPLQKHLPNENPHLVASPQNSTIVNDLQKLATSILDDPPDAASFHAHMMLDGGLPVPGSPTPVTDGRVVRLNPLIQPLPGSTTTPWVVPPGLSEGEFTALVGLDMDAIEQKQVLLISKLCDLWLKDNVANQPIRANRDSLAAEIGHARYSAAKAAWKALQ